MVVLDGGGVLVKVDVGESSQFVAVGVVGVAMDGFGAGRDGSREVFEIEFCNASEEVGFVEVWLAVDDDVRNCFTLSGF